MQGLADSALKARLIEEGEEASLAATLALARKEERDINDYKLAEMEYQEEEDDDKKEVVDPSLKQLKQAPPPSRERRAKAGARDMSGAGQGGSGGYEEEGMEVSDGGQGGLWCPRSSADPCIGECQCRGGDLEVEGMRDSVVADKRGPGAGSGGAGTEGVGTGEAGRGGAGIGGAGIGGGGSRGAGTGEGGSGGITHSGQQQQEKAEKPVMEVQDEALEEGVKDGNTSDMENNERGTRPDLAEEEESEEEESEEEEPEESAVVVNPSRIQRKKKFGPSCQRRTKSGFPVWKCGTCGKTCAQKTSLMSHVENSHMKGVFKYKCPSCPQMLDSYTRLYAHRAREHIKK